MTTAYEWTFCLTVAWTGIITGFMISYVIGRFFDWLLRHERYGVFTDIYAHFGRDNNPVTPYITSCSSVGSFCQNTYLRE